MSQLKGNLLSFILFHSGYTIPRIANLNLRTLFALYLYQVPGMYLIWYCMISYVPRTRQQINIFILVAPHSKRHTASCRLPGIMELRPAAAAAAAIAAAAV